MSEQVQPPYGSGLIDPEVWYWDEAAPRCGCVCHNVELGNARAALDPEGHRTFVEPGEADFWRNAPRWVDLRDPKAAAIACSVCQPRHVLALSSRPELHAEIPVPATPRAQLGGPHQQCEPDCHFCNRLDSPADDRRR